MRSGSNDLKVYLNIILLFLVLSIAAQDKKTTVIKVSKHTETTYSNTDAKRKTLRSDTTIIVPLNFFSNKARLSDFVKDIPETCEDVTYDFSIKLMGSLKITNEKGNWFSEVPSAVLIHLKSGDKFFIDHIKTSCAKSLKKIYIIKVE